MQQEPEAWVNMPWPCCEMTSALQTVDELQVSEHSAVAEMASAQAEVIPVRNKLAGV